MSDPSNPAKRQPGDLQQVVRRQVLDAMRGTTSDRVVDLTQGSLDYLATRASARILRDLGKRKVAEGVAVVGAAFNEVLNKLHNSAAMPGEASKAVRLDKRSVVRLVELEKICGTFPFC